jgi:hypothetical protein
VKGNAHFTGVAPADVTGAPIINFTPFNSSKKTSEAYFTGLTTGATRLAQSVIVTISPSLYKSFFTIQKKL